MKKTFLLTAMILCGLFMFASCNSDEIKSGENLTNVQNAEADVGIITDDTAETVIERIMADVPDDRDYDGYEFVILANGTEYNSYWYSKDIYAEEETGDAINDAVYTRNRTIEEKYNIAIKGVLAGGQYNLAKRSVLSGDATYDMHTVPLQGATAQLAQDGLLLDLKQVPYIDLEKPWWDERANQQLSIGHKLMFTISDLLIMDKDSILMMYFNIDVLKEYALDDPYKLVKDGTWTIDKMWDMARVATRDLNGDGIMDDTDQWGLVSQTHTMAGNVIGSGQMTIMKDEDDLPVINIQNPVLLESFEKWINIYNDRSNTFVASDWEKNHADIWDYMVIMTAEGRALFQYTHMDRVTLLRSHECNFGILPTPKLNETQREYNNAVNGYCSTSISIPITAEPERTGIILEALTAESYYTLRPAYYDISLKTKFLRDDESEEMLDLILATRSYDLGNFYNWGGIYDMFGSMAHGRKTDLVSQYEKILPRIERDMAKAIENFLENE